MGFLPFEGLIMTIVDSKTMAEYMRLTEAELVALKDHGLPVESVEVVLGVEVRRYDTVKVIEWSIARAQIRAMTR
jgi:hypothetical protein